MSRPMVNAALSISLKPPAVTIFLSQYTSVDISSLDKKVAKLALFSELEMNYFQLMEKEHPISNQTTY